ncbi:hypothetical protein KR100_01460 [Synechococcus sp. KORDI-100]|nr:hypothetical protein KR100_01460 [Synechococcus sp. KORDI-100]
MGFIVWMYWNTFNQLKQQTLQRNAVKFWSIQVFSYAVFLA